jgi:Streptogramin lyase
MTLDGHLTEYPIVTPEKAEIGDLCLGPDGALWYTWYRSNHIGRMTLDGQAQDFVVPYAGSLITSGPDGALWYSQTEPTTGDPIALRAGSIGRITTGGATNELLIPPSLRARYLIKGVDGAIWFTVYPSETITVGRITTSGEVKIIDSKESGQPSILATAKGAIWVLDSGNNTLWRYRLPA